MIDIEFAVQFLVLAHAHRFADLTKNLGNIALLKMAADHGLIAARLAERCRDAYREFRRIQHGLRLNGAAYARVPREKVLREVEAVKELWRAVLVIPAP
jgi:glutamate-ammonia-ligase adenylyltransferase